MRQLFTTLILLTACLCRANMASPYIEGSRLGSAFSSRDIDILKERIFVKINPDFATATFTVEYTINTGTAGNQVPLLFLALDYKGDFRVWIDGAEGTIMSIPEQYKRISGTHFRKFSGIFDTPYEKDGSENVTIYWNENAGTVYNLNELKYFEANLTKGMHTIKVQYDASPWINLSHWVQESSFRYSLSPAKYWKSFGSLEIIVDATAFKSDISFDLGDYHQPQKGIYTWKFNKLPANSFEITYKPEINQSAQILIAIDPFGLMGVFSLLMMWLHYLAMVRFRRKKPAVRHSVVVIVGSIVIPFLVLASYPVYYSLIDAVIGELAAHRHGYTFMMVFFYPVVMPLYWLAMWLMDWKIKQKFIKKETVNVS